MSSYTPAKRVSTNRTFLRLLIFAGIAAIASWATLSGSSAKQGQTGEKTKEVAEGLKAAPVGINGATRAKLDQTYGNLPLSFEANRGQTDASVKYLARGPGYNIFLTPAEAIFVLRDAGVNPRESRADQLERGGLSTRRSLQRREINETGNSAKAKSTVLSVRLEGANPNALVEGLEKLPGKVNYFRGNDSSKWLTDIDTYSKVAYRDAYPGIDLVYYGNRQQLEYDLIVAPGADPGVITLDYDGAQNLTVDRDGNLLLKTQSGELRQLRPVVYQEIDGEKKLIDGRYLIRGKDRVGFRVSRYDRSKPLVIDPILVYSSLINAGGFGSAIAVDSNGFAYITGDAFEDLNPTAGAYQTAPPGFTDTYVTKINQAGTDVVYTTFLGGNGDEQAFGIAIDSAGNAFVTGYASGTFPTTVGSHQRVLGSTFDAFITKLNPTGSALVYSTLYGGNGYDEGIAVAVDAAGNASVAGDTRSSNLVTTAGAFQTANGGGADNFVLRFSPAGLLTYATYLGGGGSEIPLSLSVDSASNIYVAGETSSLNYPQVNAVQGPNGIDRGIFRSINFGTSWTLSQSGLTTSHVSALAIDPIVTAIMYAGTVGGVSKSTNGGVTWTTTAPTNSSVLALAIDPSNTSIVYAGTNNGVYKTTNAGGSWTPINNGLALAFEPDSPDFIPSIRTLTIDPNNPSIVYTGTGFGLFKSTDGGASWTRIGTGLTSSSIQEVVIDPVTPATLYVGTNSVGVFKSTNSGANFTAMNSGITNLNIRALAIGPPNATATLYAGTTGGIFKTTNGGTSWTAINAGLAVPYTDSVSRVPGSVNVIVIDQVTPTNIYAGSSSAPTGSGAHPLTSLHRSTDGGATWTAVTNGFGNLNNGILALAINPGDVSMLFLGTAGDFDGFATRINANGTALLYSTFVGSSRNDYLTGIVPDAAGNTFISGVTPGTNFPVTAGAFRTTINGPFDTFVMKLNAAGNSRIYSTYLGGSGDEDSFGLAIDSAGNAYVTGWTTSTDFPVTSGAFQTTTGNRGGLGTTDGFVTKLNPTGTAPVYSSYLGGAGDEFFDFEGGNIAVDPLGNAYVVGATNDFSSFPFFDTANGFGPVFGPSQTFVVKIDGNTPSYSIIGRLTTTAGVPLAGVVVEATTAQGFSRTTISDNEGYYSIISLPTADYTVTPDRASSIGNFVYTPASRSFPGLNSDQTANFVGSQAFLISGRVTSSTVPGLGIFDVTMTLTGTSSATVVTDANGDYTFFDLAPGNYTVTPSKAGFTFNPANRVFNGFNADRFGGDFTTPSGTFFTVNGKITDGANVPLEDVLVIMTVTSQTGSRVEGALTDASGNYSFPNLQSGGNYTFEPIQTGFTFSPPSRTFINLSANQVANFTGGTWQPVVLTSSQVELKTWNFQGRTYAYVKLLFPNAGYRVNNWGTATRAGNDFTAEAEVEKFTGGSVQAVTTTAQIYDLGPLANGTYNFNFRTSGALAKTLQFIISSTVPPPNPIDDARTFVKWQYRDFLNREPDQAGEDFWTDNITKCNDPARRPPGQTVEQCTLRQRETTSGAFFLSPEFQYTGYYVYRAYQGALARQPKLSEFIPDAQFVGNGIIVNGQLSASVINQNKAAFAAQFVNCTDAAKYRCAEFKAIYDPLNNTQYVDKLFQTTGVNASAADRTALVNGLNGGSETRATVLQKVVDGINVISEGNQQFTTTYGQTFYNNEFNRAFVLLEYFGYMRRDPDDAGYAFWLAKLNQFGGNFVNAEMVLAFISSPEYRARFGQP